MFDVFKFYWEMVEEFLRFRFLCGYVCVNIVILFVGVNGCYGRWVMDVRWSCL